ncbi:MAG TPA: hypothetical protein VNA19_09315, partial [Pyrinomonadaceae bacterium]|nr:hypothetical protein [Pyrinomonadaceae bacterium]
MDSPTPKTFRVLDRESLSRAVLRPGANHLGFAASVSGVRGGRARYVADFPRRASLFDELAAKYSNADAERLPDLSMLYRLLGPALARIYLKWLAAIDFSLSHTQLTIQQFINQPLLLAQQFITHTTEPTPRALLQTSDALVNRHSTSLRPAHGERVGLTRELVGRVPFEHATHTREDSQRLFAQLERLLQDSTRRLSPHVRPEATTPRRARAQSRAQQAFVSKLFSILNVNLRLHSNDALANISQLAQALPASTLQTNFWGAINQSLHLLVAPRRDARDVRGGRREQSFPQSITPYLSAHAHAANVLPAPQANSQTLFTHALDAPPDARSYLFTRADAHASQFEHAVAHLHRHLRTDTTLAHAERPNALQHASGSTPQQTIFTVVPVAGRSRSETFQTVRRRASGETTGTATTRRDASPALRSASRQILLRVAEGSALETFLLSLANVPRRFIHPGRVTSGAGRVAWSPVVLPRVFVAHDRADARPPFATTETREPEARLTFISKESTTRERLPMPFVAPPRAPEPNAGAEFLRQVAEISRQEISRREVDTRAPLTTEQFAQKVLETLAVRPEIFVRRRSVETPSAARARAASSQTGADAVFDAAAERFDMSPLRAQFAPAVAERFARALANSGDATTGTAAGLLSENVLRRTLDRIFVTRAARDERPAGNATTEKGETFTTRGERTDRFERERTGPPTTVAQHLTPIAQRLTPVEVFNAYTSDASASFASREPLVLLKRMISLTERETLARMGRLSSADVRARTEAETTGGARERSLMLERTHGRERVLIPVKSLSDGARMSPEGRTPEHERGLMRFVSVRRSERGRGANDRSASPSSGGEWGESFLSSLSIFRSQNLLREDARSADANTTTGLSQRISHAS